MAMVIHRAVLRREPLLAKFQNKPAPDFKRRTRR
jgi:hypothetical protein